MGASTQGNPTPGAGLQGEGKAETSGARWTWAWDRAPLGKAPGAQGTRGAQTPQLLGPRRKAVWAALEGQLLHCGRQLRSPGRPGGLCPQSAEITRLMLSGCQVATGGEGGSPGTWRRFAADTQKDAIAQDDPLLWE